MSAFGPKADIGKRAVRSARSLIRSQSSRRMLSASPRHRSHTRVAIRAPYRSARSRRHRRQAATWSSTSRRIAAVCLRRGDWHHISRTRPCYRPLPARRRNRCTCPFYRASQSCRPSDIVAPQRDRRRSNNHSRCTGPCCAALRRLPWCKSNLPDKLRRKVHRCSACRPSIPNVRLVSRH